MRIYISGAITGTKDYLERFAKAEMKLKAKGYEVINPAKVNAELPLMEWEEYMEMSLTMLSLCSEVFFLKGWRDSRGACMEYGYAIAKGLKVMEE